MAYGPRICAACGTTEGVETHHLYLESEGCPDDLTVWLCFNCHGRAHGMRRSINLSERIKAALAAAKDRGVRLGNPKQAAVNKAAAAERDASLECLLRGLGGLSYQAIADELTRRGIATPRGGTKWNAMTVMRAMKRLGIANPA